MITTLPALCTRTLVSVRPRLYCVTVAVWRVVAPAPSGEAPLAEGDKTGPTQPGQQYIGARGSPNSPIVLYFVSVLHLFCYISKFYSLHKKNNCLLLCIMSMMKLQSMNKISTKNPRSSRQPNRVAPKSDIDRRPKIFVDENFPNTKDRRSSFMKIFRIPKTEDLRS